MASFLDSVLLNAAVATALAIAVWVAAAVPCIRRRPGLRHLLWIIVLLKLVTPPVFELSILPSWLAARLPPGTHPRAVALDALAGLSVTQTPDLELTVSPAGPPGWPIDWTRVAAVVSGLGTAAVLLLALGQTERLRRALRQSESDDERVRRIAGGCAAQMGLATPPRTCVVAANVAPLLWVRASGPLVVVPRRLVEQLTDEQLGCVLAHEIAHYLRRDHWTNLLSLLVAAACWWNPVAWWARRELRTVQEACCDALVITRSVASRRKYAETLFQALEFLQAERSLLPALASGFGGKSSTERRFEMVANPRVNHRLSWWSYPVLLAALSVLPWLPSFTQAQDEAERVQANDFEVVPVRLEFQKVAGQPTDVVAWSFDSSASLRQTDRRTYKVQRSEQGLVVLAFDRKSRKLAWSSEIEQRQRDRAVAGQRFLLHTGGGVVTIAVVGKDSTLTIEELDIQSGKEIGTCLLLGPSPDKRSDEQRQLLEQKLKAAQQQLQQLKADLQRMVDREIERTANEALQGRRDKAAEHLRLGPDGAVIREDDNTGRIRLRERMHSEAIWNASVGLSPVRAGDALVIELKGSRDGRLTIETAGNVWRLVNGDNPIESIHISREGGKDRMVIEGKTATHRRIILHIAPGSGNRKPDADSDAGAPPEGASMNPAATDPLAQAARRFLSRTGGGSRSERFDYSLGSPGQGTKAADK